MIRVAYLSPQNTLSKGSTPNGFMLGRLKLGHSAAAGSNFWTIADLELGNSSQEGNQLIAWTGRRRQERE